MAGSRVSTPTGRAGSRGDPVTAFVLVALAPWGVPGLSRIWPAPTIAAASLSLVLLVAFWNNWLMLE